MTKLVYLDSSDFSNLSVPDSQLSGENRRILELLRERKRAGAAVFYVSAVHLSEAVHAAGEHKEAAVRRAELIRELCGSNILRLPNDLPKLELQKALSGKRPASLSFDEITSRPGEWFGIEIPPSDLASLRADLRRAVEAATSNLPRRERRKRRAELDLTKTASHEKWRELLKHGSQSTYVPYPFNLLDASVSIGYVLGEISGAEFRKRIVEIASDPFIIFKYLVDESDKRAPLYNSLRPKWTDDAETNARQLIDSLSLVVRSGITPDINGLAKSFFSQPQTLRQIIASFEVDPGNIPDSDLRDMVISCPALLTFVKVNQAAFASRAYSYLARIRAGKTAVKASKPSDFGDLMHSYYAPYFDVFRCDASFAAHLKSQKPLRPKIADRIGDLVTFLEKEAGDVGRKVA